MLLPIVVAVVFALAASGYGWAATNVLKISFASRLERLCLSLGLGVGFITAAVFWIGIAGGLFRPAFLVLLLPAAAIGAWSVVRILRDGERPLVPLRGAEWALLLLLGLCAAANVLGALAPPTFADALTYHLYVPAQFLERGAIVELSAVWQHYSPMAVEMAYMTAQSLAGPKAAALLGAGWGLLAAAGTALLGRRLAGRLGGLIAAVAFYANPMVAWESTSCFVDLAVAALGTLGLYATLRWNDQHERGWFMAAALLTGFAASCKLNAGIFVVVGALLVVSQSASTGIGAGRIVARVIGFGALAAAPLLPWLVRSLLLTGNPVYPFATGIFGNNPDRAAIDWVFNQYGVGYSLLDRLLTPWNLLTQGSAFENGHHLSPLPLLMAPIIFLRARKDRERRLFLGAAVVMFGFWAAGGHVARYLLPLQPLACVLAADAVCRLASESRRRRVIMVVLGAILFTFGTVNTLLYNKQFVPVVIGREPEPQYLERVSWHYNLFREVCASLPTAGRVLTNSQQPTYYLNCPNGRARDGDFEDPARLRRIVAEGKFTHVLLIGHDSLQAAMARLVPAIQPVWQRTVDVLVSRTFGRTSKQTVAFYEVKTGTAP